MKLDAEKIKPIAKALLGEKFSITRVADDLYKACGFFRETTLVTYVSLDLYDNVKIHISCLNGDEKRYRNEIEKILPRMGFTLKKPKGLRFNLGYVYDYSRNKQPIVQTETKVISPEDDIIIPDNSATFSKECKLFTRKILQDLGSNNSPIYTLRSCYSATDSAIPNDVAYRVGNLFKSKHYSVYLYYTWRSNTPYKIQISKHKLHFTNDNIMSL